MIAYFARHPNAANLLMLAAILLGLSALPDLERETFPEFAPRQVSIRVAYPGASALDVDETICQELEDAISGTTGLADLDCLSVDGLATATAELEEGGEITQFYNDIASAVSATDLPDDAETAAVSILGQTEVIALLAVSGIDGKQGLSAYADALADRIQALPAVAEATVSGITERELKVTFDQDALRRYGFSGQDLVDAIEARSLRQPLGTVETAETNFTLRYSDARRDIEELEELVVLESEAGGLVRLKDLASVGYADADENVVSFINGAPAAIVSVAKTRAADSLRAFAEVEDLIGAEEARLPDPFAITVVNNVTEAIETRLDVVLGNIAQGLVLVFATMWLFFRLGEALWISAALPVSFLGSLFVMSVFGLTINMVSLVGLLMAVGLIMDDSIVIAENIAAWRRRVGGVEAAIRGTAEVLPGVVASFLTTACVFGPLMFLSGQLGAILKVIPMVLLITLSISLVEAFVILPHHLSHSRDTAEANARRPAARLVERFKVGVVLPLAAWLTAWRYLTLGSVTAVLVVSIGLIASGTIKVIGFPTVEGDTIEARIALTSGIPRARTVATVERLLAALERVDAELTSGTGGAAPLVERVLVRYAANADMKDNGSNTATITVDLLESEQRGVLADDVLARWRAAAGPMPDLIQSNFTQSVAGPGGADLDVELLGRDLEQLEAAANGLVLRLMRRDDVVEAFQDFFGGRQEVRLRLNDYAFSIGLTPQALAAQLRQAFAGSETDTFRVGASTLAVRVELGDTVASLSELESFPVSLPGGRQTALSTVAHVTLVDSYPQVTRKNGLAVARVEGKIDRSATTSAAISAVVTEEIGPEFERRYPGIDIRIGGATEEQNEAQSSILTSLLLGLVGVYMVLAFQFRSYALPLAVMLSIPFALVGTILGHWAMGMDLAMPSFIGFASLAGIVVNNAILFLTFFRGHLEGDDYVAAALGAVGDRFRPILLSSTTTFVGLLPIIFETSPQVQTLVPLVVAVAFGLLASTVLVVLVFPSVLAIYFDIFSVRNWMGRQTEGTQGEARTGPHEADQAT